MTIHCPNCKNTSEALKDAPGYGAWFMAYASLILGGIGMGIGLGLKEPFAIWLASILSTPAFFAAFGYIFWSCRRFIDNSDSARCSICRYPWGVPVTQLPDPGKPPVLK
jgi:hypothetical protein